MVYIIPDVTESRIIMTTIHAAPSENNIDKQLELQL